jgi:hypothetical protein
MDLAEAEDNADRNAMDGPEVIDVDDEDTDESCSDRKSSIFDMWVSD